MVNKRQLNLVSVLPRGLNVLDLCHEFARAKRHAMRWVYNTRFFGKRSFGCEPQLVSIGSDYQITDRVTLIAHDGGIQVPFIDERLSSADVYGCQAISLEIVIRNNCLIRIGSIVRSSLKTGSVIAGNSARAVSTIKQYFEKNRPRVIDFIGAKTLEERASIIFPRRAG